MYQVSNKLLQGVGHVHVEVMCLQAALLVPKYETHKKEITYGLVYVKLWIFQQKFQWSCLPGWMLPHTGTNHATVQFCPA